ncbi:MAG: WecB/TagA/CpsF family glycosyltransferase [Chloroflexaceae bacterium]|nr:WecB/TagA/CpsF family glycosyltransferase [Chloroflexaceae bacterium]
MNIAALPHCSVLNLPVHLSADYPDWLLGRSQQGISSHVVTLNAEMAMLARKNPTVAQVIRQADLVIPDGAGVALYLKLRGYSQPRTPGIELAETLLQRLARPENSSLVAFFGGKPGVAQRAAHNWQQRCPNLKILVNHGYLSESEQRQWQQTLQNQQPALILVGLGVPRQEHWIIEHRTLCPQGIWIGVGGSFDIWSGSKTRAPRWMCNNNLEWLYRLYQEPWRWRRMLALPQFVIQALLTRN